MTWYRFDWELFVTDELLAAIGGPHPVPEVRAAVGPLTGRLLGALARRELAPREYPPDERTRIALRLLQGALGNALASSRRRSVPGYLAEAGADDAPPVITALERVALNRASATEIDRLPGITPTIAARVVEGRRTRPFAGLDDLAERIDGIGPATVARIAKAVTFALPTGAATIPADDDFARDWRALVDRHDAPGPLERLAQALETLLSRSRIAPDPAPPALPAGPLDPPAPPTHALEGADVLGSRYHAALVELLAGAASRIDLCMFHIAMPSATHPTRRLLDEIVSAHRRGLAVRVLVDSDRAEDPYLSTVINAAAIAFLGAAGVPVRVDAPEALLHSKFLVIDDDLAVLGSHNWSAGSYFQFDDLSLAMRSTALASELRGRFDGLWAVGVDP